MDIQIDHKCQEEIKDNEYNDDNVPSFIDERDFESSIGSYSSTSDSDDDTENIAADLRCWAIEGNVTHSLLDSLLLKLRRYHPNLPKSGRTLLETPQTIQTTTVAGMECLNFELRDQLTKAVNLYPALQSQSTLYLSLNIDGMSPFKSSPTVLWPVMCSIANLENRFVFPLTITCGKSKPSDLEFLEHSVREFQKLSETGLVVDGKHFDVILSFIVCDAPAKAFVKGTKLCTGFFGCDKCDQKGERFVDEKGGGRIIYSQVDGLHFRSDQSFRQRLQPQHHISTTPLESLTTLDMVTQFPVDYMHQVCLGVMRKFLLLWVKGTKNYRISQQQVPVLFFCFSCTI